MSAKKKAIRNSISQRQDGKIEASDLKDVKFWFEQIHAHSIEDAQMGKMNDHELRDFAFKYEMLGFKARYLLWRRREKRFTGN
jgi:hypothetical protein